MGGTGSSPPPARENAFRDAIDNAVELMRRLDARFLPTRKWPPHYKSAIIALREFQPRPF